MSAVSQASVTIAFNLCEALGPLIVSVANSMNQLPRILFKAIASCRLRVGLE